MGDRPRRILVLDGSKVVLDRMSRALTDAGYEVVATSNVVGNGRHLSTCDLAIIGFHLPGFTGDAVVTSLRGAKSSREVPCLFYLYTSDANATKAYAQLGFDGFITDKGDDAALVRQVQAVFRLLRIRELGSKTKSGSRTTGQFESPAERRRSR